MNKKKIIFYACILLGLTLINQMFSSYNYSYYVDEAALITLQQASLAKVIFLCFDGLMIFSSVIYPISLLLKQEKEKLGSFLGSLYFAFLFYLPSQWIAK